MEVFFKLLKGVLYLHKQCVCWISALINFQRKWLYLVLPYIFVPLQHNFFACNISGLKDLADFLPATLATIVSYFSAEVTRGIWKPVFMNGTDWPSPSANLSIVEQQIKKIIAATGVDVPSLAVGIILYHYVCSPFLNIGLWTMIIFY